ncbi:MAG: chemotaxis protein CheW [Dehalococcoidia bacterium]|nr:chemotaxis protein CheW [Dehalococcoidia bacterium]
MSVEGNRAHPRGSAERASGRNDGRVAGEERQLVVFELNGETYGVEIHTVREIIRMQKVTFVPDAPDCVEGVINLRGRVIPVVDLRKRFRMPEVERGADVRILVVDIEGEDIGVIVDAVTEVKRVPEADIQADTSIATTEDSYYIEGIARLEEDLLILLSLPRALGNQAIAIAETAQAA